jgi:paraquat-inducible protein B
MTDPVLPRATVKTPVEKRRRISLIWAIPAVTLLIAAWLVWHTYSSRGPTVTVTFQSGEGLVAKQSHVKHLDVDMGVVESIALARDYSHVIVTLRMNPEAKPLLTEKAKFWVVRPRFFAGNISGLQTLVSGSYIEILPSMLGGKRQRHFTGLEDPPVLQTQQAGSTFLLKTPRISSLSLGSPIFYRDLTVGEVLGWDLAPDASSVTVHAFVRAPFDKFVNDDSRFWDVSGLSVELGAGGLRVQLESLQALILGGIAFETPKGAKATLPSESGHLFPLYASREAANNAGFARHVLAVSYFQGSIGGLQPGSPVTFQGLRVGQVTDVDLEYDPKTDSIRAPVHYEIEPERIANVRIAAARGPVENARLLVDRGLRAEVQSVNLLTGQMRVALEIDPNAPPARLGLEGDVLVIPAIAGGFAGIESGANQLLAKLSRMPFEKIGKDLDDLLNGASKMVNGPELAGTLVQLRATLDRADETVKHLDAGLEPAMKQLPAISAGLQASLAKAAKLAGSVSAAYGQDSKFSRDLNRLMVQLNETAWALRALADLLTRHPEALIRGRTNTGTE